MTCSCMCLTLDSGGRLLTRSGTAFLHPESGRVIGPLRTLGAPAPGEPAAWVDRASEGHARERWGRGPAGGPAGADARRSEARRTETCSCSRPPNRNLLVLTPAEPQRHAGAPRGHRRVLSVRRTGAPATCGSAGGRTFGAGGSATLPRPFTRFVRCGGNRARLLLKSRSVLTGTSRVEPHGGLRE